MGPRDTGMPDIQEMSPTVVFCPLPRAAQLPPLVTEAGNHRGEDTHKQNTGHKNESLALLAKQTALDAVHSLAVSQQVEISLASFNTAKATGWQ